MRVIIQRVTEASVTVNQKIINKINQGYLIFVGFNKNDTKEKIPWLSNKILTLRIFSDEKNLMNRNIIDVQGEILIISQFTLYANVNNGKRPSFDQALNSQEAKILYDLFIASLNQQITTKAGVFGADMKINSINNGPVTIIIDAD